jgi:uncharacterized protein YdeI (YjbR/CyaY-like superfamily)
MWEDAISGDGQEDGVTTFFEAADEFAAWLDKHGAEAPELIVGFYKRGTARKSMSWPESVDAALCFGWIDGVRKRIDEHSYQIRFTPRKPKSIWSAINVERLERSEELKFRKEKRAWKFFEAQPRGYRQQMLWRIVSAKRPETRERRLAALIKASQEQQRL